MVEADHAAGNLRESKYSKKGLLVGAGVAILIMLALLSSSIEIIIMITLALVALPYFLLTDYEQRKKLRKFRYYILAFVVIMGFLLSILLFSRFQLANHQGDSFMDQSIPKSNEGFIFGQDGVSEDLIDFPDKNYYYQASTDYFGDTEFIVELTVYNYKKSDFERAFVMVLYYYDLDLQSASIICDRLELNLSNVDGNIFSKFSFSYDPEQYSYNQINYLFKLFLEIKGDKYYETTYSLVEFDSNLEDLGEKVNYVYKEIQPNIASGELYEGGTANELMKGPEILYTYAIIILLCYLLILVLCFVWQRFEILNFLLTIYILLGVVVLFWYITWGSEDPSRLGIPNEGFGVLFHMSWDLSFISDIINAIIKACNDADKLDWWEDLEYIPAFNLDPLRMFILAIIAMLQWIFSVGIFLLIMIKITLAFGNLFKADQLEDMYEMKLAIKDLAAAISKE